jgi:hypothetical protein
MAIEIKNRVEEELDVEVHLVQLVEGPTIARLAGLLVPQLDSQRPPAKRGDDESPSVRVDVTDLTEEEASQLLDRLDELSDEEVDALMHRMNAQ